MKKFKKKICIITSSRAEFGLLSRLIKKIQKTSSTQLIVTGSHISKSFGNTIKEIRDDGFTVFATAPMYDGNSFSSTVKARQKFSRNNVTARRVAEGGDPMAYWEILSHVATKDYADGDPMFE